MGELYKFKKSRYGKEGTILVTPVLAAAAELAGFKASFRIFGSLLRQFPNRLARGVT